MMYTQSVHRGLCIVDAPLHERGFYEARPRDVLGAPEVLVVDVRPYEDLVGDLGHIQAVISQPAAALLAYGLMSVSKSAPVAIVCNNGRESRQCAETLHRAHGFVEVYHLVGGMIRWSAEECPVSHDVKSIRKVG